MPGERPLQEYQPTLDADGTMRCFVASDAQPHETFELRWSCPSAATAAWMTVDGEAADAWCSSESYPFMGYGRDRRVSATSTRPFKFAPIQLTDNTDLACEDEQIVKNLGSITCELKRFVGQARGYAPQAYTAPKSKTMHEQTKKAKLAHTAALGDEVYSPAPQTGRVGVPIDITPFARFRFDYRSLDMLRIDGVAPPEPAPAAAAAGPSGAQPKPQIKAEPTSRKRPSEADTKPDIGAKKKRVVIEVRCELECALTRQIDSD